MIAPTPNAPSMNAATEKDPFNNNCYGTTVDRPYKPVRLPVLDVEDFNDQIILGYGERYGENALPPDVSLARALIPAGAASLRHVSEIAPQIPAYLPEQRTGRL